MIRIALLILFTGFCQLSGAQNYTGQWKGSFYDNSDQSWGGDKSEYVLEVSVKGKVVSGYSYTYFNEDGKKYYTICKIQGTVNPIDKYIEVRETERTKTNVPVNISNCFQVHKLRYVKDATGESLTGNWITAPGQKSNCGYGFTKLVRRPLNNLFPAFNAKAYIQPAPKPIIAKTVKPGNKTILVAKATSKKTEPVNVAPTKKMEPLKPTATIAFTPTTTKITLPDIKEKAQPAIVYEKRDANLLRTINVENELVKIEFYDNGKIDGDSISVFFNEKLIIAQQMLREKPLLLTLRVDPGLNELVMYADNLGSIPPNTALMIVRDGDRKYEVAMSSDLNRSGTIRFIKK